MYYKSNMYKKAVEYYQDTPTKQIHYSLYKGPKLLSQPNNPNNPIEIQSDYLKPPQDVPHIKWETKHHTSTSDPQVWGPAFWFTLHNGAAKYPISASPITKDRMKGFILGIPVMLPCANCQVHATNYIEKYTDQLDDICSGRDKLFKFFVDFHNIVNKRYNKPIVSVEDAYKRHDGGIHVSTMSFV